MGDSKKLFQDEKFFLYTFASTHHVLRADQVLANSGYQVQIIPTPREISVSCGIAIKVPSKDHEKLFVTLTEANIPILRVFKCKKAYKKLEFQELL